MMTEAVWKRLSVYSEQLFDVIYAANVFMAPLGVISIFVYTIYKLEIKILYLLQQIIIA